MLGIPPVRPTDIEDVAWALQTADTLFRRGERGDAIVWLRRAAQAAGDATDDDRALELARSAAELSEWLSAGAPAGWSRPPPPRTAPPHGASARKAPSIEPPPQSLEPDEIELVEEEDDATIDQPIDRAMLELGRTAQSAPLAADDRTIDGPLDIAALNVAPAVPAAADVHAGMLSPWDSRGGAPEPASPVQLPAGGDLGPVALAEADDEEVVTSASNARLAGMLAEIRSVDEPTVSAARAPEVTREVLVGEHGAEEPPTRPAMAVEDLATRPPARAVDVPSIEIRLSDGEDAGTDTAVTVPPASASAIPASAEQKSSVDLAAVEPFGDLPDDVRDAFARAGVLHELARDEEIGEFALAYVVDGDIDVCATIADAPAARVSAGTVMRARGTAAEFVGIRLVGASDYARVLVWEDAAVEEAFRDCPWVEDDLRAAADRIQTTVGVTMGPLGDRLDPQLRALVASRLEIASLLPGEEVVREGAPVPGLLIVGVGELELSRGGERVGAIGSGEFLFPSSILSAETAPATARAGAKGALVMRGNRMIAQELLVTCPPLLEIFAGM